MKIKSNSLKSLQGTLQDSKVKNYEAEAIPGAIFPLTKTEEAIFNKIRLHLETNSASAEIDCIYVSVAARIVGQLVNNAKALKDSGSIMTYPNGTRQISAEWTAFKQSFDAYKDISKVLGLDPKSRLSMDYFINNQDDKEDPFAEFLTVN
jgi:phage terminase small subunit